MATIKINCKTYAVIADKGMRESTEEEAKIVLDEFHQIMKVHPTWPEDFAVVKMAANRHNMEIIEIKEVQPC